MTETPTGDPPPAASAATPPPANPWWRPPMRDVLALLSTALIAGAFFVPMFRPGAPVDPDLKGALLLQWGLVMGYYFGTSKTSVAKDKAIVEQLPPARSAT